MLIVIIKLNSVIHYMYLSGCLPQKSFLTLSITDDLGSSLVLALESSLLTTTISQSGMLLFFRAVCHSVSSSLAVCLYVSKS